MNAMIGAADIADAAQMGLSSAAEALDVEQAVRGLDSLDELRLHAVLAEGFRSAGYGVHREQRYPAKRAGRKLSEGSRCDFVLTPDGRGLKGGDARMPLFEDADALEPEDAWWLEVKCVWQFVEGGSEGYGARDFGANPRYSAQLLSTVQEDVLKLSQATEILHGGVMIVMFVESADVATHDLRIWQQRCIERGLALYGGAKREVPITNRIGNGVCVIAVHPVGRG